MKPFILVLACLSVLVTQAQRTTMNQELREADQTHREVRRELLELNKIVVTYERDSRTGEYHFNCTNKTFATYTVELSFPELENLRSELPLPATIEVTPGTRRILTLTKTGGPVRMRYHYSSFKGSPRAKVDTGYAYLLPIAPGKETHISELSFIGAKYGSGSAPKDWYSISVHMKAGDTVYAARGGRVTETSDEADLTDSGYAYTADENYLEIVHNDGTFGKYTVFRDKGIFVQAGDWVEAGQPLGIVGGDKYTDGPQVRFSVRYHLKQEILDKDGQPTGATFHWAFVPLDFWAQEKGKIRLEPKTKYTSEHPAELVTKEMSKKDARKWKESHKTS